MLPLSGSLHCSAILSFVQVDVSRFRSYGDAYEGSVSRVYVKALYSYVHTYLLGFVFRTNPRGIPASIDSSARNLAENHSGIVRKIRARPRGYPRPPAPENRGIRRKNVSYPCQVPYILCALGTSYNCARVHCMDLDLCAWDYEDSGLLHFHM